MKSKSPSPKPVAKVDLTSVKDEEISSLKEGPGISKETEDLAGEEINNQKSLQEEFISTADEENDAGLNKTSKEKIKHSRSPSPRKQTGDIEKVVAEDIGSNECPLTREPAKEDIVTKRTQEVDKTTMKENEVGKTSNGSCLIKSHRERLKQSRSPSPRHDQKAIDKILTEEIKDLSKEQLDILTESVSKSSNEKGFNSKTESKECNEASSEAVCSTIVLQTNFTLEKPDVCLISKDIVYEGNIKEDFHDKTEGQDGQSQERYEKETSDRNKSSCLIKRHREKSRSPSLRVTNISDNEDLKCDKQPPSKEDPEILTAMTSHATSKADVDAKTEEEAAIPPRSVKCCPSMLSKESSKCMVTEPNESKSGSPRIVSEPSTTIVQGILQVSIQERAQPITAEAKNEELDQEKRTEKDKGENCLIKKHRAQFKLSRSPSPRQPNLNVEEKSEEKLGQQNLSKEEDEIDGCAEFKGGNLYENAEDMSLVDPENSVEISATMENKTVQESKVIDGTEYLEEIQVEKIEKIAFKIGDRKIPKAVREARTGEVGASNIIQESETIAAAIALISTEGTDLKFKKYDEENMERNVTLPASVEQKEVSPEGCTIKRHRAKNKVDKSSFDVTEDKLENIDDKGNNLTEDNLGQSIGSNFSDGEIVEHKDAAASEEINEGKIEQEKIVVPSEKQYLEQDVHVKLTNEASRTVVEGKNDETCVIKSPVEKASPVVAEEKIDKVDYKGGNVTDAIRDQEMRSPSSQDIGNINQTVLDHANNERREEHKIESSGTHHSEQGVGLGKGLVELFEKTSKNTDEEKSD